MENKVVSINSLEQIRNEASLWVVRNEEGLDKEQEALFTSWLNSSEKHQKIYKQLQTRASEFDELSRLADIFPYQSVNKTKHSFKPNFVFASTFSLFILASLVFTNLWDDGRSEPLVYNSSTTLQEPAVNNFYRIYRTKVGVQETVELPDSSVLLLNTDTFVRVHYSNSSRSLILDRGEIHIDVAHNKKRPLSVIVGDKIFEAVGTAFNIEYYDDKEVALIVTEGKVKVSDLAINNVDSNVTKNPLFKSENIIHISKGEQIVLQLEQEFIAKSTVKVLVRDSLEHILSWQKGEIIFDNEPLAQVLAEYSRYTGITFEIKALDLEDIKVVGRFKINKLDQILSILESTFSIVPTKISKDKILLSQKDLSRVTNSLN